MTALPALDATVVGQPHTGVQVAVHHETLALLATAPGSPWLGLAHDAALRAAIQQVAPACRLPALPTLLARPWARILWQQTRLAGHLRQSRASHLLALAGTAPLACPVPLILQVHDTIALRRPDLCRPLNAWHMRLLLPPAARAARTVIVAANAEADALTRLLGLAHQRLVVVPLGLDATVRTVAMADAPPAPPPPAAEVGEPYLLFVGPPDRRKGLRDLLGALTVPGGRLPPLLLVGPGMTALPAGFTLPPGSRALGYVPRAWLPGLYAHAALTVVPSHEEGFSLPLLEALACGSPVLHRQHPVLDQTAGGQARAFPRDADAATLRAHLADALAASAEQGTPTARWRQGTVTRHWAAGHTPERWASAVRALLA